MSNTVIASDVSTVAELNAAIIAAEGEAQGEGDFEIDLKAGADIELTSALEAINLKSGVTLDIEGHGATLDGWNETTHSSYSERGLFVYSGDVSINDLTIKDTNAIGGKGGTAGGGGAGLGGGLFVAGATTAGGAGAASDPDQAVIPVVNLDNVTFDGDIATGGAGGGGAYDSDGFLGGGGGMGGDGGDAGNNQASNSAEGYASYTSGGGGGGGIGGSGGGYASGGSAGIVPDASGGGNGGGGSGGGGGGGSGGGSAYQGGGVQTPDGAAGGGGIGGGNTSDSYHPPQFWPVAGNGGFGGGGGGNLSSLSGGGAGGFGGGGGGSRGAGGFGGGGGGFDNGADYGYGGSGGAGGFGGGHGGGAPASQFPQTSGGGGGGLGAGGDIFVQQGGTVNIVGGYLSGAAVGGNGGLHASDGEGYGETIFLQGNQSIGIAAPAGQTLEIRGTIADQDGSVNSTSGGGVGSIVLGDASGTDTGTVEYDFPNTYTGGTTLESGVLELFGADAAAGSGAIKFGSANPAELQFYTTLTSGDTFSNTLTNVSAGDRIDLQGLAYEAGATATLSSVVSVTSGGGGGQTGSTQYRLTVTSGGETQLFTLAAPLDTKFVVTSDGIHNYLINPYNDSYTGTLVTAAYTPTITGTAAGQTTIDELPVDSFKNVDIQDKNANPTDSVTITLVAETGDGGTLSGAGLSGGTNGVYTLAAAAPSTLDDELHALVFKANPGAIDTTSTTQFDLSVTSNTGTVADDDTTTVVDSDPTLATLTNNSGTTDYLSLSAAIAAADQTTAATGDDVITLTGDNVEQADPTAIDMQTGVDLTVDGASYNLDGDDAYGGIYVYSGDVTIKNLTILNARAVGGAGGAEGGGGAGLGGGLYVADDSVDGLASSDVTLSNVAFSNDSATGGRGGPGGYGGGGGGEFGAGSAASFGAGGAGPNGEGAGGPSGGQGGYGGGGGAPGGGGGFGGGGAGGASGDVTGGRGGFGGGGGGGFSDNGNPNEGSGGFGGGAGAPGSFGGGGGGFGAGGDIFVQGGASLTIEDGSTLTGGAVHVGDGQDGGVDGLAAGEGIFIQGGTLADPSIVTLGEGQAAGQTLTISGIVADQAGTLGTNGSGGAGSGALVIEGLGTVALDGANTPNDTFTGGVTIDSGTLELGTATSAGTGAITFAGVPATLQIDPTPTSGTTFANTLTNLAVGDTIDLRGLAPEFGASATLSGSTLTVTSGVTSEFFTLAGTTPQNYAVSADGHGGTLVTVANASSPLTTFVVGDDSQLNAAITNANDATTPGDYTIQFASGTTITETSQTPTIALHSGVELTIDGQGGALDGDDNTYQGLSIESGDLTVEDLTIQNASAIGGAGSYGGGGGAGLGGGLFVGDADGSTSVTVKNVAFSNDTATGGDGGFAGFDSGGGLGGGLDRTSSGAGGGFDAQGGFGGGGEGGIASSAGGDGGFGGGGGGGGATAGAHAGAGGYGGGGGGQGGYTSGGVFSYGGGGGGGLGAGGDIFVQAGAALAIEDGSSLGVGGASGGQPGNGGAIGSGLGQGLFIEDGTAQAPTVVTLGAGQTAQQTTTISGEIADVAGPNGGAGTEALDIEGQGTVALDGENSYAGGTTIESGTLEIGADGSAGSGAITFQGGPETLRVDGAAVANTLTDFNKGDALETSLAWDPSATAVLSNGNDTLTVTAKAGSETFTLANEGGSLAVGDDGGRTVVVDAKPPTITGAHVTETTASAAPVKPFSGVTIADPNGNVTDTLTITLSGAGGTLSGAGLTGGAGGVYTLAATSPGTLSSELDKLAFAPDVGATEFTLVDTSSAKPTVVNDATIVADVATNATLLGPSGGAPITTIAELNAAIVAADGAAANSGAYQIDLAPDADVALSSALEAINLKSGVTLDIEGDGATLDGENESTDTSYGQRGLFVYSGVVDVSDLTVTNAKAVGGAGGSGYGAGGGGAGLGGGLFIAGSGAPDQAVTPDVTLAGVAFFDDAATGGAGGAVKGLTYGAGGGGGMGGAGGSGVKAMVNVNATDGGGGGGVGAGASGGVTGAGGIGAIPGATGGGSGGLYFNPSTGRWAGGASGGGGGGGGNYGSGGGGGGVDGVGAFSGGGGGFGGGGGAAPIPNDRGGSFNGGVGGFGGGGGGSSYSKGGGGGFGGGGGGGIGDNHGGGAGFGGGAGGANGGGGGGLGAGGDIFVQGGATLDIEGGTLAEGTVTGGAGGGAASKGEAAGGGIFIEGGTAAAPATVTLGAGQTAGETTTISGVIADEHGSGGTAGTAGTNGAGGGTGGLVIQGLGTVTLNAANTFAGGIDLESGTLVLGNADAAGTGAITFGGGDVDPTLVFSANALPTNPIVNFGPEDQLVITNFTETGESYSNGVLTLDGMNGPIHITINNPDPPDADFPFSQVSTMATCYCLGTRILTDKGEVAVERLAIGDLVVTASGERMPIRWIGWREIDCARHSDPEKVWPVRIAAGAIAPGMPVRELAVSPEHSLSFDDVLVPAHLLVNGSTIVQQPVEKVSYWHVELDRHDLLVADGLAAESYLDCDNRNAFANAGSVVALHPDFAPQGKCADAVWAERGCAPRCLDGPRLAGIQKSLAERATRLGARTTADARLQVLADGEILTPVSVVDRCFRFEPPEGTTRLRLRSRAAVPARLACFESADVRCLGVSVWRLEVDGREIALDDPLLFDGWHEPEGEAPDLTRWSDGDAELPVGREIALWLQALPAYPLPPRCPAAEPEESGRMGRRAGRASSRST